MKNSLLLICCLLVTGLSAQITADFENFDLAQGEFLNNNVPQDTFTTGNIALPNSYNENYDSFDGWAISATTDTVTRGFMNQFSSRSGGGANGSTTYGLAFAFFEKPIVLTGEAAGEPVEGLYLNNGTYSYFSMLEGDGIAKKFGGETGDDPDFFLLTIQGELNGERTENTVEFYLADYRFEDNSMDYIVSDWTYVDLSSLGNVDVLWFGLTSSDVGEFGMNTPAYIYVDDVTTAGTPVSTSDHIVNLDVDIYPNPAGEFVHIASSETEGAMLDILSIDGRVLSQQVLRAGTNQISLHHLNTGIYFFRIQTEEGFSTHKVIKK